MNYRWGDFCNSSYKFGLFQPKNQAHPQNYNEYQFAMFYGGSSRLNRGQ